MSTAPSVHVCSLKPLHCDWRCYVSSAACHDNIMLIQTSGYSQVCTLHGLGALVCVYFCLFVSIWAGQKENRFQIVYLYKNQQKQGSVFSSPYFSGFPCMLAKLGHVCPGISKYLLIHFSPLKQNRKQGATAGRLQAFPPLLVVVKRCEVNARCFITPLVLYSIHWSGSTSASTTSITNPSLLSRLPVLATEGQGNIQLG